MENKWSIKTKFNTIINSKSRTVWSTTEQTVLAVCCTNGVIYPIQNMDIKSVNQTVYWLSEWRIDCGVISALENLFMPNKP